MAGTTLTEKLNLKPNCHVLLMNAPDDFTLDEILDGMAVSDTPTGNPVDCIHLFIQSKAELDHHLPSALPYLKPDGMLWVSYPKGTSGMETDVSRDKLWVLLETHGWEAVRQVSINAIWSAMRFKPKRRISDKN